MSGDFSSKALPDHHKKLDYCLTRKAYRNGRRKTAVKVFTVNAESRSIIVSNVHATGLANDLVKTFTKFGTIVQCDELLDYPKEPFTQMFLLKFEDIQSARRAKKKADEMYFFGSILHVFYAPEYETVNDTREKLMQRRSNVVQRVKFLAKEGKRATKGGNTPNTVGMLNDEHVSEPNAAGVYMRLSSSNIRREITPALPHIRPPEVKKRHHSQANMSHNCATKASVSSTCGQGWIPPRKVPKMMRLPGYVPPKSASLPS